MGIVAHNPDGAAISRMSARLLFADGQTDASLTENVFRKLFGGIPFSWRGLGRDDYPIIGIPSAFGKANERIRHAARNRRRAEYCCKHCVTFNQSATRARR
jgi:hypothetical protein